MAHNLIVDESYIKTEAMYLKSSLDYLDTCIRIYHLILKGILQSGIEDGATADALEAFVEFVNTLRGDMHQAGDSIISLTNNYLRAIDDADQYLF